VNECEPLVTGIDPASMSADNPVRKLKGRSVEMLARLMTEDGIATFDVAYVDGSHSARDVLSDGRGLHSSTSQLNLSRF
jgi:hypothetical protein